MTIPDNQAMSGGSHWEDHPDWPRIDTVAAGTHHDAAER